MSDGQDLRRIPPQQIPSSGPPPMVRTVPLTPPRPAHTGMPSVRRLRRAARCPLLLSAALLIASVSVPPSLAGAQPSRPLAAVIAARRTHARSANDGPGIQLGLAFDYNTRNLAIAHEVSYIFGGYFLDWHFGFYPSGPRLDGYLPYDFDPYPLTFPGHSLADWQQTHPDWIVYRCDRTTPASFPKQTTLTNVPLDFSNPAVRAWQVQQAALLLQAGAKGIALDDFNFTNYSRRCGEYRNGVWTWLGYNTTGGINPRFTADMMGFLTYISSQLKHEFPTSTIDVNMSPSISGLRNVEAAAPFIDTDFDEAGFTYYGAKNLSGPAWLQEVKAIQYLNQHGKAVDVNGTVAASSDASVTHAEINWVLGNYLLVKGKRTYTYIYAGNHTGFGSSPSGYASFYDRRAYHVPIGYPTTPIIAYGGVDARGYSGGMTIVNPSANKTQTVTLGGTYTDLFGRRYTSVTLGPTGAIVLLRPRQARTRASTRPRAS
jgi:Hypothetical glycosyl hydrolase family 15